MIVDQTDPVHGVLRAPGIVPRFSATPGAVEWSGPWDPGCDNERIYEDLLGFDREELARLRRIGVV